jgi:hypothetical protein
VSGLGTYRRGFVVSLQQLRLKSECSQALEGDRNISGVDLDAIADPPKLMRREQR